MRTKKALLVNPYGQLPHEGWREYRFVTIGKELSKLGYDVVWKTSDFSHHTKTKRQGVNLTICDGFVVELVKSPRYVNNFGFGRFWRDLIFSLRVIRSCSTLKSIDILITIDSLSFFYLPGLFLRSRAQIHLTDQMDIWENLISKRLGFELSIKQWYPIKSYYSRFSGWLALARPYAEYVSELTNNQQGCLFYNGIDAKNIILDDEADNKKIIGIFAGSLGPNYDVLTLVECYRTLSSDHHLLIAGAGPLESYLENLTETNITYLGVLSPEELQRVYVRCHIGFNAYSEFSNVEMSDKFYDYTCYGLVVFNTLLGECKEWIDTHSIGVNYISKDVVGLREELIRMDHNRLSCMQKRSREVGLMLDRENQLRKFREYICTFD